MLLAAVLMALCIFQPSSVFASTGFDGACTSISLSTTNGSLLTTDQNGKVFSGTLTEPLQGTLATAGDVKQARYVLGNSRILLVYQSGAIEILDPAYPVVALARLPASTYVDVKVSRDGRWAVGLLPGRASVEVLELSPNAFRPIRRYDHPIGGTLP